MSSSPTDGAGEPGATLAPRHEPAGAVTLSELQFDVLWEHLQLPPMPPVIAVPSPGRTHGERKELVDQAWQGIEALGLGRQVGVHPWLIQQLSVLAQPEREVDARFWLGADITQRHLIAGSGNTAVHATYQGGQVTLRDVPPEGLPVTLLEVVPDAPAGPGQSVTLPSADFEAAADEGGTAREAFASALTARGIREDDVRTLVEMLSEVTGHGQFGAAARDKFSRRHRCDRVASFFDTPGGRYVQVKRAQSGTSAWTTISPVDGRRLSQHVSELLADARRVAGA